MAAAGEVLAEGDHALVQLTLLWTVNPSAQLRGLLETGRLMQTGPRRYLNRPCSGSRRTVDYLAREGIPISRDRVRNLMRRRGLRAIYQKPHTTVPGEPSERYPCLVDLKLVTAVDQVWATDITDIPLQKGFLYLVAIVDLFSRKVYSCGDGRAYS